MKEAKVNEMIYSRLLVYFYKQPEHSKLTQLILLGQHPIITGMFVVSYWRKDI
jgi:hypothetical protein